MTSTRLCKNRTGGSEPCVPAAEVLGVAGGGESPAEEAGLGVSGRGPPLAPLPRPQVTGDVHAAPLGNGREEVEVHLHEVQLARPSHPYRLAPFRSRHSRCC